MKNKLIFYPLIIFTMSLMIAFFTSIFLTVTLEDVLYKERNVHAKKLNTPWPGTAYAFYKPLGQFDPDPLCSLDLSKVTIDKSPATFHAENKVGTQFSNALSYVMGLGGMDSDTEYGVKAVSLVLPLEKSFQTTRQADFQEYCQAEVSDMINDPDYLVYQVQNAYFSYDETKKHNVWTMVSFKLRPMLPGKCYEASAQSDPVCQGSNLDYRDGGWVTRMKDMLDLISVS